ncbi:MAG TPA: DUF5691 domain-containing protein [Longimicrobium sp.]|nr:DUF5691 domain-containing protein [Longimicrobium sp.]
MSADVHWNGLLRAALLGTAHTPPPPAPADGSPLSRALAAAPAASPEAALLAAAALLATHRRAARVPVRDDRPLPAPAEAETAPPCPPLAARHLAMMLAGSYREALPEWMDAAARAGYVIPPELLPALLDAAARHPALPALVGARGRWLAAQRPEWALAAVPVATESGETGADGADHEAEWQTLPADARPGLLARVRGRDPARGLALLRSTWAQEAPRERAALLQALAAGLSMDDEPFLEAALDDRRKEVRSAAAGLLARLAGSRLVARMTERARRWLVITPAKTGLLARVTGGGAVSLEVHLPDACDKAMERDGIGAKPPHGVGERAWWLAQALAAVPPRTWSDAGGAAPAELIGAARKTEWRDVVVMGWTAAAVRHRDAEWAQPLALKPEHPHWTLPGADTSRDALFAVLPPGRTEAVVLEMLGPIRVLGDSSSTLTLLAGLRHRWSAELTRAVVRRATAREPSGDYYLRMAMTIAAPRMDAAAALDELAHARPASTPAWVDLLHHRHAMLEALKR